MKTILSIKNSKYTFQARIFTPLPLMKKHTPSYSLLYLFVFLLFSCNSDSATDCLQTAGTIKRIEVEVPNFEKITVFERLNLVLKQGETQKVEIESGENLLNEISARVEEDRLILTNNNTCNLFREYGISTVYVTMPNLIEIRSSTGGVVSSNGVLTFPELRLISESFIEPTTKTTDGSFELALSNTTTRIIVNGIAYFKLWGTTETLDITIAAGDSRIEAQSLEAATITINHRGSNDVLIYPLNQLTGVIRGYGDVRAFNRPQMVAVEELFVGKLIFLKP